MSETATFYDKTGSAFRLDHEHNGTAYVRPMVKVFTQYGYGDDVHEDEGVEPAAYLVAMDRAALFDAPLAAIPSPLQQPVAWRCSRENSHDGNGKWHYHDGLPNPSHLARNVQSLYAAPPQPDVPQLGGKPEDLRNTLCAVIELFGIDGAQKVTEYVLKHRGINAFNGKPAIKTEAVGPIPSFEAAYPELYYHIAKGKICAGEPLYGAIITTLGGTDIGHGESDVSADEAFITAVRNAGLSITTEGSGL